MIVNGTDDGRRNKMTSNERVKMALNHKQPDKIPFDLGSSGVTTINVNTLKELRSYFGLSNEGIIATDTINQTSTLSDDLIEIMNIDVKGVDPLPLKEGNLYKDVWEEGRAKFLRDEFGITWRMPEAGHYYDLFEHPLAEAEEIEDINNFAWPNGGVLERFTGMKEKIEHIVDVEKKAFMLGRMSAGMWENAMWMTGYEKFFCDMLTNEALTQAIMEKFVQIKIDYWDKALECAGEKAMVCSLADDLGTQSSLLVSLDCYKKLIWPWHKKLIDFIKSKAKTNVHIFFHTDGACKEAIPLLIEAGVDVLNPVQVNCVGMDTKALKKEFGKDICFWGALCDSQDILPFGTPTQVREETKRRIDDLGYDGGWVAAPIHNIQPFVPTDNIIAMWETLMEYR